MPHWNHSRREMKACAVNIAAVPLICPTAMDAARADLLTRMNAIPLLQAMQVALGASDGERLCLSAPLAPNVNDKGCAFGGALVSLMTVAGWALVTQKLAAEGVQAEVFVADSEVKYRAPVWGDLQAEAVASAGEDWPAFIEQFRQKGRARISIDVQVVLDAGAVATSMRARYAAIASV